jgi:hypothetical protein
MKMYLDLAFWKRFWIIPIVIEKKCEEEELRGTNVEKKKRRRNVEKKNCVVQ